MFSFTQPLWIVLGAVCCLLLWLLWRHQDARRNIRLATFVAASLLKGLTANVSGSRRTAKKLLLLGGVFCCFLALARPQYGHRWIDVKHKGIDILFALDTSKSMLAEDVRPNRLERSKFAIMDFVSQLEGDRVGLLPFAGSAYLMCPLTADYYAFEQSLMAVDTSIIPVGGTDINYAIGAAETTLSNEANHKILILITDGENLHGDAKAAALAAQKDGMTIYTVGVGTAEGELIPDKLLGGFIKDQKGSFVKSRLDEKTLSGIAQSADGFYVPLGNQGQGLHHIYREKLALIPKEELAEKRSKVPIERFEWPLAAAIILMVVEYLLSGRKSHLSFPKSVVRFARLRKRSLTLILPICYLLTLQSPFPLQASPGETAYDSGNYLAASEFYQQLLEKDPDNPTLMYNTGTTAYKNNLFDEAVAAFDKTLATDDVALQKQAYYNKGNALFRKGEETLTANPQATITTWEQALDAFMNTLALEQDNENARFNHDYVKARLDQLKQQNQQQEQQQEQKPQQNNSDKKESEDSDTGQSDKKETGEKQDPSESNDSSQEETGKSTGSEKGGAGDTRDDQETDSQQGQELDNDGRQEDMKSQDQQDGKPAEAETPGQQSATTAPSGAQAHTMTTEEAEKLLRTVQGEEGRLNLFAPRTSEPENELKRDW